MPTEPGKSSVPRKIVRVYCLDCNKISLRGKKCESCGKALPGLEDPPAEKMTNKATLLRRQSLFYRGGDISKEQFVAWIDNEEDNAWGILEATEEKNVADDMRPALHEELVTGRKGIATYLKALESLRQWLDNGPAESLQTAFALSANSDNLMDQALRQNWNTFRDLIEATREYLRQTGYSQ